MHTAKGEKSGEDVGRELLMEVTTHTPLSPYTHISYSHFIFNATAVLRGPGLTGLRNDLKELITSPFVKLSYICGGVLLVKLGSIFSL